MSKTSFRQELNKTLASLQEVNRGGKNLNEDWHESISADATLKDIQAVAEVTVKNCYGKAIRLRVTKMDEEC